MNPLPRLYAIADASFSNPVDAARVLFDAGVRLLQVRNKTSNARQLLDQVERIVQLAPSDAAVVVNDRPDIARLAQAALGPDLPLASRWAATRSLPNLASTPFREEWSKRKGNE